MYLAVVIGMVMGWSTLAHAKENKSGVSPNSISLPSGPGSIEGLGESFQPMLNTGSARYGVKIHVPAGVNGHTPQLTLQYDSGQGNGPLGIGWTFGPGSIARQTDKGIPRYVDGPNRLDDDFDGMIDEPDEVDTFLGIDQEELVLLPDNTYRARIEGTFIRYQRVGAHWQANIKDGTTVEFGLTPEGRISDDTGQKTFRWLMEKSTDVHGNQMAFTYRVFSDSVNQKYLSEIRYGPGSSPWSAFYFVSMVYEDRPDWRKDFRSGFQVSTSKRLARIDIGVQGIKPGQCVQCVLGDWNQDGIQDALIRRYMLSYVEGPSSSFLSQVIQLGADGQSKLPPISFSYSLNHPPPVASAKGLILQSSSISSPVMDHQLVELVDLNRDALPDLLKTDLHGGTHRYFLNRGLRKGDKTAIIQWDQGQDLRSEDALALQLHLQDKTVHLADMDGDGLSDLVHTSYAQEVAYYPNEGKGQWGPRKPMSIQDTAPPPPFTDDNVRTTDLDFNKRMDVLKSTPNGYVMWFNLDDGQYSQEQRTKGAIYQGKVILLGTRGVHLSDMNGDRLNDVAQITPTQVRYAASRGHGQFEEAVVMNIPDVVLTDGEGEQIDRASLEDLNGDGLSDLVIERAEGSELWYWLNLGTDTFSPRYRLTDLPTRYGSAMAVRWADLNGNGTTDLIYADSQAEANLRAVDFGELISGTAHANLLTRIDNGLGVRTEIDYQSSTAFAQAAREQGQPWTTTVPFPVSVVAEVRTVTGLDLDDQPGKDVYRTAYAYRDGFYDDQEKAFRGFSQVAITEHGDPTAPTKVTRHTFFTGGPDKRDNDEDGEVDEYSGRHHREEDALKGRVRRIEVMAEDGTRFSDTQNDWQVRTLVVGQDTSEVRLAVNLLTDQLVYEGTQTPETIRVTYDYDEFGQVTEEKHFGALSLTNDEVFAFTEYIHDTKRWILGMPRRHYRTNAQGDIVSETRSYYDGPAYQGLPFGQLTQGQLHRQEGWVEDKRYVNLTRMAYDAFGNMTGVLDPNGGSRTIQYDPLFHSFPEKETIEVGGGNPDLVIAASYNLGLGVVETNTDVNGNRTAYRYDRFGRLVSVVKPGDSELWPTTTYAYTLSDPLAKLIYHYDSEGTLTTTTNRVTPSAIQTKAREVSGHAGTFDQIQYVDGLGRELAHIQEGDEGFVVNQAVQFNVRGIVRTTGLPYKTSSAEYGAPPVGERVQIETHYDAMGREVVRTNPPDAEGMVTRMTTAYLPLKKTTVDENGIPKTLLFDGQERLREVHETNEGEIYRTRYAYHPLGHLEQVIDAQESVKEMIYDGLGRRTTLKDPDRGLMAYTYDDAGNVTQTVDNKDQTIVYTYDKVNRILTEDFHDGANHHPDIAYHYDKPSPDYPEATQVKGNLGWVEDLSGGAFFSYDARGNTTWSVKWITDEGVSKNYRLGAEYDALGRVVATLYPDGDRVEYRYNQGTLLKQIPGYVDRIEYAPSGQYTHYVYANGITTTYDYDPRNRLRQLTTQSTASPSSVLQTLSYKVDGVGNITHITDQRGVPENAPENATQTFQYDDLSRLTQAEGPGYGRITYQYDKIGNMIFKGSPPHPHPQHIDDPLINLGVMANGGVAGAVGRGLKRPGDPPGPHAVTGTESGLQFAYDDNGNMTQHNKDLYEWNAKDRLIQATTEKGTSEYVYDFRGQRVIKKVQSGGAKENVYYVSKEYEIREGNPVKFIFDGDRRVARIDQNSPSKASMEKLLFYHPDHLGSASVKTNSTGKEVARTEFYPYGRPRNWENSKLLFSYDYNGKELDNETELIYYGARFFQPNLGRFISVDPVIEIPEEQIGGSHLGQSYLYAVGNPLTFIDQDGKRAKHSKRKTHRGKVKDIRNLLKTVQIRNIKDLAETLKEKNRSREDYLPSLNSVLSQIAEDEQFANQELERSIEKLSFIGKVIFKIGGAPNDRIHNLRGHLLYLQESRKFTKQIYRRKEELIQSDYYSEIALLAWRGHRGMGNPFPTTEEEKLEFFTDIILKDVRGNFPSFMAKDFYLSSRSWSLQGRKEVGNLDWFLSEEQRPYNNVGQ